MATIALDFDGVLHHYLNGWLGETVLEMPTPDASSFCKKLKELGHSLIIFSTRATTDKGKKAIEDWLLLWDFPDKIKVTAVKPKAKLYIDDRGFRFDGKFDKVLDYIENENPTLEPWNR